MTTKQLYVPPQRKTPHVAEPRCVWTVLVMLNDNYACGAAVVAHTLRKLKTRYPIWCMVSDGVSPECAEFLRGHFDNTITVPLISHAVNAMRSLKQNSIYGKWIHASFTKWNILNPYLFPFDKVILVDADMLFLENCDDLFDMPAPALTFSSPWAKPYVRHGAVKNPYLTSNRRGGWRELAHREPVPHKMIAAGLHDGILGLACMVLVHPDIKLYDTMMQILDADELYGNSLCISGFDEQLIAETILTSGTPVFNIHQQYNWIAGKYDWLPKGPDGVAVTPKTRQYYHGKPWEERREETPWADIVEWWGVADQVMAADPTAAPWFYMVIEMPTPAASSPPHALDEAHRDSQ